MRNYLEKFEAAEFSVEAANISLTSPLIFADNNKSFILDSNSSVYLRSVALSHTTMLEYALVAHQVVCHINAP